MCVAAGWRGRLSRQGTRGSRCAGHAATGSMVTAATVDASAVRFAGLYRLILAVSRARCLQAAVQATTPQFVQSGSAPSALLLPLCCTVVVMLSWGPCCSASGPCLGGKAGGAGCGKLCALVWVLPAVLRACLREEEELVQVPVALRGGLVVECQPLFHHASRVCGLDTALQSQADVPAGRILVCG